MIMFISFQLILFEKQHCFYVIVVMILKWTYLLELHIINYVYL